MLADIQSKLLNLKEQMQFDEFNEDLRNTAMQLTLIANHPIDEISGGDLELVYGE